MEKIRVLLADDEPPARARLRQLIAPHAEFEIVDECQSGGDTVRAIREKSPDLVFLDIRMPGLDGFEVVAEIGPEAMPVVIFVTAFDEHALRAFEIHALDYLVKPFDDARFTSALKRAAEEIRRNRLDGLCGRLRALLGELPSTASADQDPGHTGTLSTQPERIAPEKVAPERLAPERLTPERLVIRSAGRVSFVEPADVDWVEAAGSYVRLHTGTRTHLLRDSLSHLEAKLAALRFVRIHRSAMVNARCVKELRPRTHGESVVVLHDGTQLKLSRGYRDRLEQLLRG